MSNLVTLPKNGNLAHRNKNRLPNFPGLSTWFDDFSLGEFPSLFSSSFNTGISMPKVNIKEVSDAFIVEMADTVNESKINASYSEGILTVQLPKKEEAKEKPARTIKIS